MAQFGNTVNQVSGPHLISDQDHMGEIIERLQSTQDGARQAEQSQEPPTRQQGDQQSSGQPRGERNRQAY